MIRIMRMKYTCVLVLQLIQIIRDTFDLYNIKEIVSTYYLGQGQAPIDSFMSLTTQSGYKEINVFGLL